MGDKPLGESGEPIRQTESASADEAEGPDGEATEVNAEFVMFRVFAINRDYKDRPADKSWMWVGRRGPSRSDTTSVTVGDLTPEFIAAVRALAAWRPFMLKSIFGGSYKDKSSDELEALFEDLLPEVETAIAPYRRPNHTYVTVTLRRQVPVLAFDRRIHRWLGDIAPLENASKFVKQASEYLDVTGVRLLRPLGQDLAPNSVVYRNSRAFLIVPGKTPMLTDVELRGTATATVSGEGWESIDWQPVTDLLEMAHAPADARLIEPASRWLWAATAETKDALRRFLFAFCGLEILANKCGKRYEKELLERLSSALNGAPVKELAWPTPHDADSPWRNLVFRFTVTALYLNPDGAAADVALFKRLASARNGLAHGTASDEAIRDLPAIEALALLRDYLHRVAAAEDA